MIGLPNTTGFKGGLGGPYGYAVSGGGGAAGYLGDGGSGFGSGTSAQAGLGGGGGGGNQEQAGGGVGLFGMGPSGSIGQAGSTVLNPLSFGGGGGAAGAGQPGACRIIWGSGCSFPLNAGPACYIP